MIVLSCKNISKSYGIKEVLKDVTFSINEGDKVGVIGSNGEGKSTLFKILTKQLQQDDGEIFIDKNKTVGYLSQHLDLDSENTIYNEMLLVFDDLQRLENKLKKLEDKMNECYDEKTIQDYTTAQDLYENRGGYTYKGEISRVIHGLGFTKNDYDKVISTLSGGQKTRVALCKLLLLKPDILLLDEPTNHLDLEAIEWLEEYLKSYKGTVIVISHDRYFLDSVTGFTFQVINGHVNCYNACYTPSLELIQKDYEVKLKAYNAQQAEIKRQEAIIERFRSFNREKSIKQAESREKVLEKMERLDAPDAEKSASKIKFKARSQSGFDVLHVEKLSKSFEDKKLFENLTFDLKRGDKVALIGDNGRGKTTLFKIIMDKIKPDSGVKVIGTNVDIGYYDQEQSNLDPEKTIIDEIWDDFPHMTTTELRTALGTFLFRGDDVFKKIKDLSGGERCRINLLKLMLSQSNFLLLDEPTNHLDIPSREALEEAILSYDGTLIVISHDRYFLNKVIHKIYELQENGVSEYLGNYTYYVDKKKNPLRFEEIVETQGKTKTAINEEKKKKRNLARAEKARLNEIKNLEKEIEDSETKLSELNESLCLEEVYANPSESERVHNEIKTLEDEIAELYEKWEELSGE